MTLTETAACLQELGHPTRLAIYRYLVRMGRRDPTVGDIQAELQIPASTLSHHLGRLARVGLIGQRREGRVIYCQPRYEQLQGMIDFLTEQCCEGQPCLDTTACCADADCRD